MANTPKDDPEDVELATYRELKRIADALETFNELVLSMTSDAGRGKVLDVHALVQS